jgi:hypothetical protein
MGAALVQWHVPVEYGDLGKLDLLLWHLAGLQSELMVRRSGTHLRKLSATLRGRRVSPRSDLRIRP